MKHQIGILILVFLLGVTVSCERDDKVCDTPLEIKGAQHLVDINRLKSYPELIDSLSKYSNLQAREISEDEYSVKINCNVFNQNLIVFGANYHFGKMKKHDKRVLEVGSPTISIPTTSVIPTISYKEAIHTARQVYNYDNFCICYQLGWYTQVISEDSVLYKLAWEIKPVSEYQPYVKVDAHTGEVLYSYKDPMYWN